jgi:haloacetate dehalogenase
VLDGFEEFDLATTGTTIHGRRGGHGPPVLLLHGIPETHVMWHQVAPLLAQRFTVVATDLRGFGRSGTPPSTPDHAPYCMRELARDQLEVMNALEFEQFHVVGHDRGARCAYRLALDHPRAVTRLAVLDIVPTGDAFRRANMDFAMGFWVWSSSPLPSRCPSSSSRTHPM